MRSIVLLTIFGGGVVQSTLAPVLAIGDVTPDIPFMVVVLLALRRGPELGCLAGFAAGLLQDVASGGLLGAQALTKAAAGFLIGAAGGQLAVTQPLVVIALDVIGWRLDDVVQKIRGPGGSRVRLQVLPAGAAPGSPEKIIELVRDKIKLEEQAAKKELLQIPFDGDQYRIGVITVPSFYQDFAARSRGDDDYTSTSRDVTRLIEEFKAEGGIDGVTQRGYCDDLQPFDTRRVARAARPRDDRTTETETGRLAQSATAAFAVIAEESRSTSSRASSSFA